MPRRRMIDPDFWSDGKIKKLTFVERLFFIGLFNHADDEGRILADPSFLRAQIFPYDNISIKDILKMRDRIAESPNVLIYSQNGNDGEEYLAFLKWDEYQKPDHARPSKIPPPPIDSLSEINPNGSPNGSLNESPNGSLNESLIESQNSSRLGQSSLVKSRSVKSSIVKFSIVGITECFGDDKKLTDRLLTTLKEYRPRGAAHMMSLIVKPLLEEAGIEVNDALFNVLHTAITKQTDEILAEVITKAIRYGKGKKSPANYIQRILDEKTGNE